MRLFEQANSYATQANAMKKLTAMLGTEVDQYRWLIGVTSEGRYVPVVLSGPSGGPCAWLAGSGICVA